VYNKGQLGLGHTKDIENPEKNKFFEGKKVINVSCGQFHTLALTSNNDLYGWGAGEYGELGTSKLKHEYSPTKIKINFNQFNILYE
jgi:alpha-tubulin suppressor-like RCC1 family protein